MVGPDEEQTPEDDDVEGHGLRPAPEHIKLPMPVISDDEDDVEGHGIGGGLQRPPVD
jgi:hypothetical protein